MCVRVNVCSVGGGVAVAETEQCLTRRKRSLYTGERHTVNAFISFMTVQYMNFIFYFGRKMLQHEWHRTYVPIYQGYVMQTHSHTQQTGIDTHLRHRTIATGIGVVYIFGNLWFLLHRAIHTRRVCTWNTACIATRYTFISYAIESMTLLHAMSSRCGVFCHTTTQHSPFCVVLVRLSESGNVKRYIRCVYRISTTPN